MTLIGATTENPYFEVNSALLSRARSTSCARSSRPTVEACSTGRSPTPSAGSPSPPAVADAALELLAERSGGDARIGARARSSGRSRPRGRAAAVDLAAAEDALQRKALSYDREGDRHYDYVSAWIKATRGSDPDASLYYLAAMLEGGEDPRFIARRMVILASEDVGNADPQALVVATAAGAGGRPRRAFPSARSTSPRRPPTWRWRRSRTPPTAAISAAARPRPRARREAAARTTFATPTTRAPRSSAAAMGYVYPHDEPGGVAGQPLMPDGLEAERFYEPTDRGFEAELRAGSSRFGAVSTSPGAAQARNLRGSSSGISDLASQLHGPVRVLA